MMRTRWRLLQLSCNNSRPIALDCLGPFYSWVMTTSIHSAKGNRPTLSVDAQMLSEKLETPSQAIIDNKTLHAMLHVYFRSIHSLTPNCRHRMQHWRELCQILWCDLTPTLTLMEDSTCMHVHSHKHVLSIKSLTVYSNKRGRAGRVDICQNSLCTWSIVMCSFRLA